MGEENANDPLHIKLLGELTLSRGDVRIDLPPSKKTRALLAYLVVTQREHLRARLCDLFWDVADDPRAALRWSLSKLRKLVNDDAVSRLRSDRRSVRFAPEATSIDLLTLRRLVTDGLTEAPTARLESVADQATGEFLEGLELSDFHDFQAWCVAERAEARRHFSTLLTELVARHEGDPERALPYAKKRVQTDSLSEEARLHLLRLLVRTGRRAEAEQHHRSTQRIFEEVGTSTSRAFDQALRDLSTVTPAAAPVPVIPATPPTSTSLIGRNHESARLRTLVAATSEGRMQVALLAGEPGVGKTRLLDDLVQHVRAQNGTVFSGASFEVEQERPYGPWVDALRGTTRLEVGDALGADLVALMPNLHHGDDEAPENAGTRDRLFGAVAELIATRANSAPPVLIVMDDIQWWDGATATLLHYVARMNRHRSVLIAMGARAGELADNGAALRVVRALRRDGVLAEIPIGPLTEEETHALVRSIAPAAPLDSVHADCGGNPLLALEIARAGGNVVGLQTLQGFSGWLTKNFMGKLTHARQGPS